MSDVHAKGQHVLANRFILTTALNCMISHKMIRCSEQKTTQCSLKVLGHVFIALDLLTD